MKRHLLLLLAICAWAGATRAQVNPSLDHSGWFGGLSSGREDATKIVRDARGDYFVIGSLAGGCDFDDGPGFVPAGAPNVWSFIRGNFLAKYNAQGDLYWVKVLDLDGEIASIDLLPSGDLVLVGRANAPGDLDPGPANFDVGNSGQSEWWISSLTRHGGFRWGKRLYAANNGTFIPDELLIDPLGSLYITGAIYGAGADFDPGLGSTVIAANGGGDGIVASYDSLGNFRWVDAFQGWSASKCKNIVRSSTGAVIVTGDFGGTVDFDPGPATLTLSSGNSDLDPDAFILSLDTQGNLNWVNTVAADGYAFNVGHGADTAGGIWLSAVAYGNADFDRFDPGNPTLQSSTVQPYIAHYNAQGLLLQVEVIGGAGPVLGDGHGGFYLAGEVSGGRDMDPSNAVVSLPDHGQYDGLLAHYSAGITYDWAFSFGNYENDNTVGIVRDGNGNLVVVTSCYGDVDMDPGGDTAWVHYTHTTGHTVSSYNPHGTHLWTSGVEHGRGGEDVATDVLVDQQGNTTVLGHFEGSLDLDHGPGQHLLQATEAYATSISQYDAQGQLNWGFTFGNGGRHIHSGFFLDSQGNSCLISTTQNTIDIEPGPGVTMLVHTAPSSSFQNFIVKYSATGSLVWAKMIQSLSTVISITAMDGDGNFYIGGNFSGTVDFDPGPGQWNLSASQDQNYLQKLDPNGNLLWAIKFDALFGLSEIEATPSGDVVIAGYGGSGGDLNPAPLVSDMFPSGYSSFFLRLNDQGVYQNAIKVLAPTPSDNLLIRDIDVDAHERIFVTGTRSGDPDFDPGAAFQGLPVVQSSGLPFVAGYDSLGNLIAVQGLGNKDAIQVESINCSPDGQILLGGEVHATVTVDSVASGGTISPGIHGGGLVMLLDSVLQFNWGGSLNSGGWYSKVQSAIFTPSGDITVCGQAFGAIDLDFGPGIHQLPTLGQGDAFYAHYRTCAGSAPTYAEPQTEFCTDAPDFQLAAGSPAGGTYAGPGVSGNVFSPQAAGPGFHQIAYHYTDSAGCSQTAWSTLTVSACLSSPAPASHEREVLLYPNPSTGQLHVAIQHWKGGLPAVRVFDAWGRLVHQGQLKATDQAFDLAGLPAGVYHVQVAGGGARMTRRWVKID